jgi:hypothetical protein
MKLLRTWVFCSSLLLGVLLVNGQETETLGTDLEVADSLEVKEKIPLSLRFGADLYRLIRSQSSDDFQGFEAVADLRIKKDLFIAAEVGSVEITEQSEQINLTTKGTYYKIGFDYNMYDNWEGMDNHVVLGLRLASSSHSQFVNAYTLLDRTPFWQDPETKISSGYATGERPNLNAFWLEFVAGFKVQVINNIYLGLSLRLNRLLSDTVPENFDNIYIPGFNKKTEDNKFGASFNYTLTYRIPFRFKK